MRPRSLVFTLFGDYFRYCGDGEAPLRGLSDVLQLFEVEPATTRVVMSRLRAEGWFETRRDGRLTTYVLSPKAWQLLDEGRERIFRHVSGEWGGQWTLIATRAGDRSARDEVRKQLTWLGFGQLQPAIWVAPGDRMAAARDLMETNGVSSDVFLSRSGDLDHDRSIAARGWDLDALDALYGTFVARHDSPADGGTDDDALVARVRLTDDYRRFPFTDPDLPADLLPAGWNAPRAHEVFVRRHGELRPGATSAIERLTGMTVRGAHRAFLDGGVVGFTRER
ncbi:phenylacetic acid degradation operon negative regulatory protein [Microbacterium testaceum]|uniref:PaaX family transcriptional regulator n=1 Tax=Microbacterium TaxID=33882 RepID=UPI001AE8E5F6|nr:MULTISPECIES: PaaX family transcriptional regulator C-terminal domain-containing protein [Microbacterium]MDQ1113578.1 phenylacetic acid degradation operon negative regulatory protein [Microbacterium testaceum]MDR6099322.1 phenylacetic acid degradation operon negative regulatory protein [Microbacterium sp. SORGH_AS_0454]